MDCQAKNCDLQASNQEKPSLLLKHLVSDVYGMAMPWNGPSD
jgi:hypothetical protein